MQIPSIIFIIYFQNGSRMRKPAASGLKAPTASKGKSIVGTPWWQLLEHPEGCYPTLYARIHIQILLIFDEMHAWRLCWPWFVTSTFPVSRGEWRHSLLPMFLPSWCACIWGLFTFKNEGVQTMQNVQTKDPGSWTPKCGKMLTLHMGCQCIE